jgi:hypothetical protein
MIFPACPDSTVRLISSLLVHVSIEIILPSTLYVQQFEKDRCALTYHVIKDQELCDDTICKH